MSEATAIVSEAEEGSVLRRRVPAAGVKLNKSYACLPFGRAAKKNPLPRPRLMSNHKDEPKKTAETVFARLFCETNLLLAAESPRSGALCRAKTQGLQPARRYS